MTTATAVPARGRLISWFMPVADITERHETLVHAPANIVLDVARTFDMQSVPLIRAIIWMRGKILGATPLPARRSQGLVAETLGMGWGVLAERPGRELVVGAVTQPWQANVKFTAVAPDRFLAFAEPDLVKIAWTLEVDPLGPSLTRFRTETRAVATDGTAQRKFLRYWRWAGIGMVAIRWLLLPALRREAERRASNARVTTAAAARP